MVTIVLDVDGTLCELGGNDYADAVPRLEVIKRLRHFRGQGAYICLYTARNMRTYNGNLGKIMAHTSRTLFEWLEKHDIPFDEVYFGKPWPGERGFYVDDRTIRPSEFVSMTLEEIEALLAKEHESTGLVD